MERRANSQDELLAGLGVRVGVQNVKATLPVVNRAMILKAGRLACDHTSTVLAGKEGLWTWSWPPVQAANESGRGG